MVISRAAYEPGWKWSDHVGRETGQRFCEIEHVGMVVSGRIAVHMWEGGEVREFKPGDLFWIAPGHDSWVVGGEPYISLHFMGAMTYAK